MIKVFRLHQGQEGTGWFTTSGITKKHLETIKTEGKEVASSIPTPFARVDLVKTAFRWVADNGVVGTTAHHKLVSDALDVAQLFYTSPKFKSKVRIVAWRPDERFKDLIIKAGVKHSRFAETMRLFWEQDSADLSKEEALYNFESVNRLYFLLNKKTNHIIGGTSPATLFFASPDASKEAQTLNIRIGQDVLFDDEYASLHQREDSFIEYFFTLSKQARFAEYFPEVYAYLEEVKHHLSDELKQKITDLQKADIAKYHPCLVLENQNDNCEVIDIPLGVQKYERGDINTQSDFAIKPDYEIKGMQPLILPLSKFSNKWVYTTKGVLWDENTQVPEKNTRSVKDSRLPLQNDPYYWLSQGNFLENSVVKLPYPIDSSKYESCGTKNYLLPLTPTFFKYFNPKKVREYLKLEEKDDGLYAELKIPVKKGWITYVKKYSATDKSVTKLEMHLAIFPFLVGEDINLNYKVGLLDDRLHKAEELQLSTYYKGKLQDVGAPIIRNTGERGELISKYYQLTSKFDVLQFGTQSMKGAVVPLFKKAGQGIQQVNFAVDFGTTNTHIEYKQDRNASVSFDNDTLLPLWQSLLNRNETNISPVFIENEVTFEQEMIPYALSNKQSIHFPLRTALVHNKQVDFKKQLEIIQEMNNYLLLEKRSIPYYMQLDTELKWGNYSDPTQENKVESYIEFMVSLIYYKTLLLEGNPSRTIITWFYPVSMDEGEAGVLQKVWEKAYQKVFGIHTNNNIVRIPESTAPYLYYRSKNEIRGLSLSIDIGGGSSDIAVFDEDDQKGGAKMISSFKFAGNAIFGDGYPEGEFKNNSDSNGFVQTFRKTAQEAVKGDEDKELILDEILGGRKSSADFSSFLFALEQNTATTFNYSRLLQRDKSLKLSILVFYGAIAYYAANLLKKSGMAIPSFVPLSGTASKTAGILDTTEGFKNLSHLFRFIFSKVYDKDESDIEITVVVSDIPKEITCKGALQANINRSITESSIRFWVGGKQNTKWGEVYDKEKALGTPKYGQIDTETETAIEQSILDFYKLLDDYNDSNRLQSKYSIEPNAYEIFKMMRASGIKDYVKRGVRAYHKEDNVQIEESLFFYPLVGILNKLSLNLSLKNVKNV